MDFGSTRLYEIELWDNSGHRYADISQLAFNRQFSMERNEAETLTFSLNLFAFENFCASINADPQTVIAPYQTDVKVKRNGVYLFGAYVQDVSFDLATDYSSAGQSGSGATPTGTDYLVTVTCSGYLNFFKDRYVTLTYSQVDAALIASDMLTQTQAQTNGSVGVTLSGSLYSTGVLRDRTFTRDNVKTQIQALTQLVDGPFDFGFSYNKIFSTYAKIGSKRLDVSLVYGGLTSNVMGFTMSRNGTTIFNKIYGLGSGLGPDQLTSIQSDNNSQIAYYVRETIDQFNSVTIQATLDQNTIAALSLAKDVLALPQVSISGQVLKNVPFLSVGDRVPVAVLGHPFLASVNALYRIEKIEVTIDENDFESEIKLTFDSYGVNQNE